MHCVKAWTLQPFRYWPVLDGIFLFSFTFFYFFFTRWFIGFNGNGVQPDYCTLAYTGFLLLLFFNWIRYRARLWEHLADLRSVRLFNELFYWVLTSFTGLLLCFIRVVPSFAGCHKFLLGLLALKGTAGFDWWFHCLFIVFYRVFVFYFASSWFVLMVLVRFYRVLLGFTRLWEESYWFSVSLDWIFFTFFAMVVRDSLSS